jgi:hypothetical protein
MIIKLIKKPDDPICCRASCGGDKELTNEGGYYCVFRGDKQEVIKCLEVILEALKSNHPVKIEND